MTTYSEKPLRILGLTVLLSISEHIVLFCPQKVYIKVYIKVYTEVRASGSMGGTLAAISHMRALRVGMPMRAGTRHRNQAHSRNCRSHLLSQV